ncbi:hypothetical protein U9M48_041824 [Paspalum notatum var. saurae]|uniref:Protein kinase domain-containing protein n=1 Tax=Paspalum notatum var. saurae TaxID=547442 RepID=A0AAQ3UPB4_PASNO
METVYSGTVDPHETESVASGGSFNLQTRCSTRLEASNNHPSHFYHCAGLLMDGQEINLSEFFQTNGRQVLERVKNNYTLRHFTANEIRVITNGYSTMLGNGAFGQVYKGMLDDGSPVAVKRYIHVNEAQKRELAKEVIVHSQINHKNVVRLLGCCTEENALMIVLEFISNGNLSSFLHCNSDDGPVPFPLDKRLNVAIDIAEGIWFMHSMYSPVLHGDMKPDNILLDENLVPKISDFGIARLLGASGTHHTQHIIGTIGYMDPAVMETGILTTKSDVYSFGVVLMEIVTRKKAVDGSIVTFARSFDEAQAKREALHMFDEEISGTENMKAVFRSKNEVSKFNQKHHMKALFPKFLEGIVHLAAKCLLMCVRMRPEMSEVVASLRRIRNTMQREQETHQFGNLNIFSEIEMKKMTKNYRMTFREESCECLYNGILGKDRPVIVQQLKTCSETDREIFLNTMIILSQRNHKNVVNIVGFHLGKSISMCVYESCCDFSRSMFGSISLSNRNLYDTIFSVEKLPLHLRLTVAVQCAEGLVHIHSLAAENPDLCGTNLLGNFRSANIFLDKNFVPKVFNMNLSTFLGLAAVHRNTISDFFTHNDISKKYYLDPRDDSSQLFSPKSDVYSFGVVLLELITWKTVRYMSDGRAYLLTTDFLDSYRTDCTAIDIFGKGYD